MYLKLHHNPVWSQSDVIIGLGCHDVRVAERSAALFLEGWAPWLLFTGYQGNQTAGQQDTEHHSLFLCPSFCQCKKAQRHTHIPSVYPMSLMSVCLVWSRCVVEARGWRVPGCGSEDGSAQGEHTAGDRGHQHWRQHLLLIQAPQTEKHPRWGSPH